MAPKRNRGLAMIAVMALVAVPLALADSALAWAGDRLDYSASEPISLALIGLGLIGLSQTLVRKFRKT